MGQSLTFASPIPGDQVAFDHPLSHAPHSSHPGYHGYAPTSWNIHANSYHPQVHHQVHHQQVHHQPAAAPSGYYQQQIHHEQPHVHHEEPVHAHHHVPVQKVILREHVHVHNIHRHNLHKHNLHHVNLHEQNVNLHKVHVVPIKEKIIHNYDHHQTKVIPHHEQVTKVIPTFQKVVQVHKYAEREHPVEINHGWRQEHQGWQ